MGHDLHLPYAESPADEFQLPDGSWAYTLKAIVTDSWLLWKHALPEDPALRRLLDATAVAGITALAGELHSAHTHFPDYKALDDSPFQVSCWWDPSDFSGQWNTGRRLLARVDGYQAADLAQRITKLTRLAVTCCSAHWIEVSL
jgi:hypothetical protein